jgi:hypothetical protein
MNLQRVASMFCLLAIAWSVSTSAHHSTVATYNTRERAQIKGVIVKLQFRNPHSFIHILAADAEGEKHEWAIECAGIAVLIRDNVSAKTLKPGEEIIVTGHPGRNPAEHRLLMLAMERPSDGWKSSPAWAKSATQP